MTNQAVFHRLVRNDYHTKAVAGQGILLTVGWSLLFAGRLKHAWVADSNPRAKDTPTYEHENSSDSSSMQHPMTDDHPGSMPW